MGPIMVVGSLDNRREAALTSQGHGAIFERILWRLHYDCAVSVQSLQCLCKTRNEIQGGGKECKHIRRSKEPSTSPEKSYRKS